MVNPLERRSSIRIKAVIYIKHGLYESGAVVGELQDTFTRDLSIGGLSFVSFIPYKFQNSIYLEIDLPGLEKSSVVIGRIARCEEIGPGQYTISVQFIETDKIFQTALVKYINDQGK
jgi:hypothetical protein